MVGKANCHAFETPLSRRDLYRGPRQGVQWSKSGEKWKKVEALTASTQRGRSAGPNQGCGCGEG